MLVCLQFLNMLLCTFSEGTTTNGDYLLPFKTGAFLPKAPVLPVILRYPYERFSPAWDTISGVSIYLAILTLVARTNFSFDMYRLSFAGAPCDSSLLSIRKSFRSDEASNLLPFTARKG